MSWRRVGTKLCRAAAPPVTKFDTPALRAALMNSSDSLFKGKERKPKEREGRGGEGREGRGGEGREGKGRKGCGHRRSLGWALPPFENQS